MAKPPVVFDTKKMKDTIKAEDAVRCLLGIDVPNNGLIHCINPAHTDKHRSCSCKGDICHCFACNETWDIFDIAKIAYPTNNFIELCKYICDRFGLDVYSYSNLREVEETKDDILEQLPISDSDFRLIGLNDSRGMSKAVFLVSEKDYNKGIYGFDFGDDNKLVEATYREMVKMGMIEPRYDKNKKPILEDYIKTPTFFEMWKEDKDSLEEMIIDKAVERAIEKTDEYVTLNNTIEAYKVSMLGEDYTFQDVENAEKLYTNYIKASKEGRTIPLTVAQKNKVEFYGCIKILEDELSALRDEIIRIMEIKDKVIALKEQREARDKKKKDGKYYEICD